VALITVRLSAAVNELVQQRLAEAKTVNQLIAATSRKYS